MDETPNRLTGGVDMSILTRTPQLFDQSPETIASELLQNARRAGATRVTLSIGVVSRDPQSDKGQSGKGQYNEAWCTVHDDGQGIDDFQDLVTFGGSGWSPDSSPDEDYAGMGVFVLATRGCIVHSGSLSVTLTTAVFTGTADAEVTTTPHVAGTAISFPCQKPVANDTMNKDEAGLIAAVFIYAFTKAARYFPIPVIVNGEAVHQQGFLDHSIANYLYEGVTIGVVEWSPRANKHEVCYGGHLAFAPEGSTFRLQSGNGHYWVVRFDVGESAAIRLRLPARDEVIRDAAFERLQEAAANHLTTVISNKYSWHDIPWMLIENAIQSGFNAKHLKLALMPFATAAAAFERSHDRLGNSRQGAIHGARLANCAILPDWLAVNGMAHATMVVHSGDTTMPTIVLEERQFEDNAEYDRLPQVTAIGLTLYYGRTRVKIASYGLVADDTMAFSWTAQEREDRKKLLLVAQNPRPDRILFTVTITTPDTKEAPESETTYGPIGTHWLLIDGDGCSLPTIVAAKSAATTSITESAACVALVSYDWDYRKPPIQDDNQNIDEDWLVEPTDHREQFNDYLLALTVLMQEAAGNGVGNTLRPIGDAILAKAEAAGFGRFNSPIDSATITVDKTKTGLRLQAVVKDRDGQTETVSVRERKNP